MNEGKVFSSRNLTFTFKHPCTMNGGNNCMIRLTFKISFFKMSAMPMLSIVYAKNGANFNLFEYP